ncbi:MAG TPA: ABC transporter permease [Solirubrobacterales bacterium]|nr:ABC transporter permease [Solirubrobacterales bacterium]
MIGALVGMPLAAVGEVGEGFFKERSVETLGCVARSSHLFCGEWAREHLHEFATPALEQLEMVVISVLIGFAVAFLLALLARRFRYLEPPLLAGTGILFAIPSVAFFILLLPITGRGRETAIVALSAYTLQIIYRNVLVGLHNVPESAKDAARGMGLTNRQILWKVEIPLAIPEIVAGLRVAVVSTMAIATLAVLVNAGGLGAKIYGRGLLTFPTTIILAGVIAIVLALLLDAVLLAVQRLITPWRRAEAAA